MCPDHTFFEIVKFDCSVIQREMLESLIKEELQQIWLLGQSNSY